MAQTTRTRAIVCLLGVSMIFLSILRVKFPKTPILGAWIGVFKPNGQNIESFVLSKLTDVVSVSPSFGDSSHVRTAIVEPQVLFCTPSTRCWVALAFDSLEPGVDGRYVMSRMQQMFHGMWYTIKTGPVLVIRDFSLVCHTLWDYVSARRCKAVSGPSVSDHHLATGHRICTWAVVYLAFW